LFSPAAAGWALSATRHCAITYLSASKEWAKSSGDEGKWRSFWQGDAKSYYFIGKDNIPFHTILFPGFLLGTHKKWALVDELSVNEYLNYEGGQFSKSRNMGVFGDEAKNTGIPADVWSYYLMVNRPESSDTEFTWEDPSASGISYRIGSPNFVRTNPEATKLYSGNIRHILIADHNLNLTCFDQLIGDIN